jgi:hypothetical protein
MGNSFSQTVQENITDPFTAMYYGYFRNPDDFLLPDKRKEKTIHVNTTTLSDQADKRMIRYIRNKHGWEHFKTLRQRPDESTASFKDRQMMSYCRWTMMKFIPYMLKHAHCTQYENTDNITFAGAGAYGCTFLVPEVGSMMKAVKFQLYQDSVIPEIHLTQEFSKTGHSVSIEKYCFAFFDKRYWVAIIIMEKIDGVLSKLLQSKNTLSQETIEDICKQMIRIIYELDRNDIHHCDLNLGNIGYVHRPDGGGYQLKLIDFGIGIKGKNLRPMDFLSFFRDVFHKDNDDNPNVQKIRNYFQKIGNSVIRLHEAEYNSIVDQHGNFVYSKISKLFYEYLDGPSYIDQQAQHIRRSIQVEASKLSPTITGAKSPFHNSIVESLKTRGKRTRDSHSPQPSTQNQLTVKRPKHYPRRRAIE